jgi:hypothetical protein
VVERKPDPSALIEIAQKGFEAAKVFSRRTYTLKRSTCSNGRWRGLKSDGGRAQKRMRHDVAKNVLKV